MQGLKESVEGVGRDGGGREWGPVWQMTDGDGGRRCIH